jgi:hypothetical protein
METTKDIEVRPSSVSLWSGILAGPFAFALVFEVKYALVDYICRNRAFWIPWAMLVVGLLICAFGAFEARRGGAPATPRAHFMSIAGLALSIGFAIFIIALTIPHLFLGECD